MYDIKLEKNEQIILISDNTIINDKLYTSVITNKRLLILDYPSQYQNSQEELRILGRINYIKMKEVIFSKNLKEIKKIVNNKILFNDTEELIINDKDIINKLKEYLNKEK